MLYEKFVKSGSGSEHVDMGTSYSRLSLSPTPHLHLLGAWVHCPVQACRGLAVMVVCHCCSVGLQVLTDRVPSSHRLS
jgi:hypothetical protein